MSDTLSRFDNELQFVLERLFEDNPGVFSVYLLGLLVLGDWFDLGFPVLQSTHFITRME